METLSFLVFLVGYTLRKIFFLSQLPLRGLALTFSAASAIKFKLSRKLIFGRGKLGQPVSHLGVITLAGLVFLTGGLLSGTPLIREPAPAFAQDYLPTPDILASPIIPETVEGKYTRVEPLTYTVKEGDTLSSIGERYRLSVDALRYANDLSDEDYLSIGQELSIPPVEGVLHTVKSSETVASLAAKYKVAAQTIIEFNYLFEPFTLTVGEKLIIPEAEIPAPAPRYLAPPPAYVYAPEGAPGPVTGGSGTFIWPVEGRLITQSFHSYHLGVDIGGFSPIFATDGGKILTAGWSPWGLGYMVKIDHGNGYTSTYGHMSRIDVSVGQAVGQGQIIGQTGNTGRSFGTHLHFIIQLNGRYLNPLAFF